MRNKIILTVFALLLMGGVVSAQIDPDQGGTGIDTYVAGDLIYASTTLILETLPIGSDDQVLTLSGGFPVWTAGGAGSGDVTAVGDCASGLCLDGTSDGGTYIRLYDGDSDYIEFLIPNIATTSFVTFPSLASTTLIAAENNLSDLSSTSTAIGFLGLTLGTDTQAWDTDLDTYAGITPSANVQSILGGANYAAIRALLDLEAGTDFYSISAADTKFAQVANNLSDLSATSTAIGNLGLTIGADTQAWDLVLDDLAGLSVIADNEFIVGTGAGVYTNESGATVRTSLGLAIGTNVQAWDDDLDDLAGLTPTKGDILTTAGTNWTDFGIGSNGKVLVATSSASNGLAWSNVTTITDVGTLIALTVSATITADGLTLDANENITLGSFTLDHDGTTFVFNDSITLGGASSTIYILEQAEADPDFPGYGQLWVDIASPNELFFTDDAGNDMQLGLGDISDVFDCTTGDCNQVTVETGEFLNVDPGGEVESTEGILHVNNDGGATIFACTAVYISGFDIPSNLPEISIADSDATAHAIGLVEEDIVVGANGKVIVNGHHEAWDTVTGEGWSVGDELYLNDSGTSADADCGNTLTNVRPANTDDSIQKIGTLMRIHATQGEIQLHGDETYIDVPNLENAKIWIGSGGNVATALSISGDGTLANNGALTVVDLTCTDCINAEEIENIFALLTNNLSDLSSTSTAISNLGLTLGADTQAWDTNLDTIAGLSITGGNIMVASSSDWVSLSVGANGLVLMASSTAANGVSWEAVAGGGSGDVEAVGDCASGLCLDGSSDGGTFIRIYDGDSHYLELNPGNITANRIIVFRDAAGTVLLSGDQVTGEVVFTFDSDGSTAAVISDGVVVTTWDLGASAATTVAANDNDTSIATTAYVQTEINALGGVGLTCSAGSCSVDLGTSIVTTEITNGTILEIDLDADSAPNNNEILTFDSTGSNFDWHTLSELGIQPLDSDLTTIAGLTATSGNVMFAVGNAWASDATPAIDCTDCINVPAGSHAGTITWTGTSILETGAAFQFGDASDATLTHTYANTGTNISIAYSSALFTFSHGLTLSAGNITQAAGTTLFMGGLLDAIGAVDMDYGSGDITDHTFLTDGAGTSEIVLPAGAIDSTEILDATILNADINASAAIVGSKLASPVIERTMGFTFSGTYFVASSTKALFFENAITIQRVECYTSPDATAAIDVQWRTLNTPNTAGTSTISELSVLPTSASTTSITVADIDGDSYISVTINAASSTGAFPDEVTCGIGFKPQD